MIIKSLSAAIIFIIIFLTPLNTFCQNEILIGLIPEENIFRQMDRYRPLAEYLSKKLGIKVKLTIISKYGDIIDNFAARKMDGAFFDAFTAVIAMDKLTVEPVARPITIDIASSNVKSYIIARKDSGIKSVRDMKNKRWAFVDKASVTGYLFAIAYLKANGIKDIDRYFKEFYFTGSHDSAIYSVLDYRADIGTVKSKIYKRMVDKNPILKNELLVIAESGEFPDITLCLRGDMPKNIKLGIKNILLKMDRDPEGREVLNTYGALSFSETTKDDFLSVIKLINQAGIDIKKYKYK